MLYMTNTDMIVKQFPYNKSFFFDSNGALFKDGFFIKSYQKDDILTIETIDGFLTNTYQWFFLLSHYLMDIDFKDLTSVIFFENNSKVINVHCGYSVLFKEPLQYQNDFYRIPGFSGFCINKKGIVKSIKNDRILNTSIGPYGYPYVNIRDHDKEAWRSVSIHILLAKAFIKNTNPIKFLFVNHKDGIKTNLSIDNLEWVSSRDNQNHAVEFNLRTDNLKVKVLDLETKLVTKYSSKSKASYGMGFSSGKNFDLDTFYNGIRIPKLHKNRYEVKFLNDDTPWYHLENNTIKLNLFNGPYFAKNIKTNEIFFATTIKSLGRYLGIDDSSIYDIMKNNPNKTTSGYLFKAGLESDWPTDIVISDFSPKRSFTLTNVISKEKISFKSLRQCVFFLKRDKRTFLKCLHNSGYIDGWEIKEL